MGGASAVPYIYTKKGVAKQVHLAGCQEGLVEDTVKVIKNWLVCAATRPAAECFAMDDLLAAGVQPDHVPFESLGLPRNCCLNACEKARKRSRVRPVVTFCTKCSGR